jgi:hypothetical protein
VSEILKNKWFESNSDSESPGETES